MLEQSDIFVPMVVQMALMLAVGIWLIWARVGSVARGKVNMSDVARSGWQGWIKQAGDNFDNQHQLPHLFFTACFLLYLTNSVSDFAIIAAWVFALSRIVHAGVHLTFNHIMTRFLCFFVGVVSLAVLFVNVLLAVL